MYDGTTSALTQPFMHIHLVTIGAPHLSFAREGFAEYIKRLGRFHKVQVTHIKDDVHAERKMHKLISEAKGRTILLDEHGKQYTSRELATQLADYTVHGDSHLTVCIGGPEGHSAELRTQTHHQWSLSKLTLPHDLAMLFAAEALYRASTITAGHPYHRA